MDNVVENIRRSCKQAFVLNDIVVRFDTDEINKFTIQIYSSQSNTRAELYDYLDQMIDKLYNMGYSGNIIISE